MLTDTEGFSPDHKMLRTLTRATNRRWMQQQLYQRLLNSISSQKAFVSSGASEPGNPQNLPKLPVPELSKTFEKYLRSVKPLLSPSEFENTQKVVREFCGCDGVGAKLQEFLAARAKNTLNWLEDWWLDTAYLGFRQPVTVYSSPGQAFPFQEFKCEEERLIYTAKLIMAAASYKTMIDAKKIPVEKQGKQELDMNQYNKIFGTCRIPGCPTDCLEFNPESEHIVVVRNNNFFKLTLFKNCEPLSEKQVLHQLRSIMCKSNRTAAPVGVLSSDHRDNWAQAYADLIQDEENERSVRAIQKSLFLVCMDGPMPTSCDNRRTFASRQLIHGGGSCGNAGNRWFDKTVQFVIGEDGIVGLTYEHSPSEGQPIAVMVDYLVNFMAKDGAKDIPDAKAVDPLFPLCFNLSKKLECAIETANANVDKLAANLDMSCFTFEKYGKEFIKSQKLSPDSFFQMAMQYAYYRMYKKPAAHYESAATRKYVGGRTETIRSCSLESVAFAKAMLDKCYKDVDKANALKAAINSHKEYSVEAGNGFGVDRHLLGLKLAAKELDIRLPCLYQDISYTRSTHFLISSSQVATKCDGYMCYGPTADNGYGCCYNPRDNTINISVSSFTDCPDTNAEEFRCAIENSLLDMQAVLLKAQKAKL